LAAFKKSLHDAIAPAIANFLARKLAVHENLTPWTK
jgi:hypothetical protein